MLLLSQGLVIWNPASAFVRPIASLREGVFLLLAVCTLVSLFLPEFDLRLVVVTLLLAVAPLWAEMLLAFWTPQLWLVPRVAFVRPPVGSLLDAVDTFRTCLRLLVGFFPRDPEFLLSCVRPLVVSPLHVWPGSGSHAPLKWKKQNKKQTNKQTQVRTRLQTSWVGLVCLPVLFYWNHYKLVWTH